jgi:hypothetical protein
MRGFRIAVVLTIAVLFPTIGNAQAYQFRTPPPDVSAAVAPWQISGEPIVVGGVTYYPTRGFRLFDGQVMVQTGMFEGVPVYSDTTIEPYSELYVPISNGRMRVYERRRERELAGTTGSHVPMFPVDSPSVPAPPDRVVTTANTEDTVGTVGTGGTDVPRVAADKAVLQSSTRPRHTVITPVQSGVANGVWLQFNGARWYSDGPAESFSPDRFEPVGEYHGFPVYRDKVGGGSDIWVAVVKDGPLAPYKKQ